MAYVHKSIRQRAGIGRGMVSGRSPGQTDNGATPPRRRPPPHVIVVDDDARLVALVQLALAKEGIDVTAATSGAECLDVIGMIDADLIVLDVVLPDLSGWEVLRRIREHSDVAVMLLTGRDSDVDKARGFDLGADDYVTKPFSFLEFEARVRALLRRSRRSGRVALSSVDRADGS